MSRERDKSENPDGTIARRITLRLDGPSLEQLEILRQRSGEQGVSALLKLALAQAVADEPGAKQPLEKTDLPGFATSGHAPEPERDPQPRPGPGPESEPKPEPDRAEGVEDTKAGKIAAPVVSTAGGRQVRLITLAFDPAVGAFDDEALRAFIAGRELLGLDKHFFQQDGRSYWSVWVEYRCTPAAGETRRRPAGLSGETLRLFEALREWRREAAGEAGVPVFVVATNRQLEVIAQQRPRSRAALAQVPGFGKKKLARHGEAILSVLAAFEAA